MIKVGNFELYKKLIVTILFSIFIYTTAAIFNDQFMRLMSITGYLTWHIIFEFFGILVAFSIFTVTYFVYEESANLNMIILGCAFLMMGILDLLHTFSFKGMSDFFISNSTANRGTTLWILSRTCGSLGILLSVAMPSHIQYRFKKELFAVSTTAFSILLFYIVTFIPNFFPPMFIEGKGLTNTKIVMEYVVILIMAITFIIMLVKYKRTGQRLELHFLIALILMMFTEFAFTNYGSVYDVYNYIGHMFKIIAAIILYRAIYIENVSEPYRQMKKAKNDLKDYSENLTLLVKQRTKELMDINALLIKDIEYAKEMQLSLMPEELPEDPSLSIYAEYLPAEQLSGDFYNAIRLDDSNIALYLGDVSGHGVSAAMLTVFANQNTVSIKEVENNYRTIVSPVEVLNILYKRFNQTNFNDETYLIMLYGIYNIHTKLFRYASAGLNVSPYVIKSAGELEMLDAKGFSICKLGDYITPSYEEKTVKIEAGDKLFLYTDGLIECKNSKNELYGQENMEAFLLKNHTLNASELKHALQENLIQHIGQIESLMDDVTFLIMEIH